MLGRILGRTLVLAVGLFIAVGSFWVYVDLSRAHQPGLVIELRLLALVCLAVALVLIVIGEARRRKPIVIAVDGTAASGKGTLAKRLAAHFGFAHLDSGSLYRLVALGVLEGGGDPANETDAVAAARAIDPARRDDPAIRSEDVGKVASQVAAFASVRACLHDFQRNFIAHPPQGAPGAVLDGRDIGTVIAPNATVKLFVDAKPEVRAHRRWLELKERGIERDEAEILAEILARDKADAERAVSPLKRAADAILLDTSDLAIDAAFEAALALVTPRIETALKARQGG
jgi:cytidylate kinase